MKPKFNEQKATQLACILLSRNGGKMSHLKLMKLMYLIDRETLIRWGWSMTGDNYSSMPYGMVLSRTYNLVNEESFPETYWKQHITPPQNYIVELRENPNIDELSEAETDLIEEIFAEFGHWNRWDLVNYVHELPEWTDPKGSSIPVDYKTVLQGADKSEQEIFEILDDLEEFALFENIVETPVKRANA